MDRELFKLPALTSIGGFILRIIEYITVRILLKGTTEWTLKMGRITFFIDLVSNLIIFIMVGMIIRRIYTRKMIMKSATLLVIYSIILLALEQITQYFGIYNLIIHSLYLPVSIFTIITSILMKISPAETITWIYAIPSLFAPYLFVLFGRKFKSY